MTHFEEVSRACAELARAYDRAAAAIAAAVLDSCRPILRWYRQLTPDQRAALRGPDRRQARRIRRSGRLLTTMEA